MFTFVYHLTEAENLPSIVRHGLLSTSALLDHLGVRGEERNAVEKQQRSARKKLADGFVIRDQRPMPPSALAQCLIGLTAPQWYQLLNSKVFFWFDRKRLDGQRRAGGSYPQVVLKIDAHRLLQRHGARAAVTSINTGYAMRRPASRCTATFVPYGVWKDSGFSPETQTLAVSRRRNPVELAIAESVPDIMDFVLEIEHLGDNGTAMEEIAKLE
ncbi:MAG: DUF7002 family protein [Burkholderiales bacterium]